MDGVEQAPLQPEARVRDLAREARRKACFQATQDCFSGSGTMPQIPPNTMELESAKTLRTWYLPESNSMLSESLVLGRLDNLTLVPSQQSVLDNGVHMDQWHFPRDQASQPHNDFVRRLVVSVKAHRQASVLLLANLDCIME